MFFRNRLLLITYKIFYFFKHGAKVILYAVWQKNSYTVTYNYTENGGTSATKTSAKVNYGSSIDLTPTATKSGYTFVGWNTNKNGTSKLSSLTMGTSNVTLYAIYSKTVTATCYYYSGTAQTSKKVSGTMYNKSTTASVNLGTTSLTGYTFRGWSTSNSGSATIAVASNGSVGLSSNATYYACYSYTVTGTYKYYNGTAYTSSTATATAYMNSSGTKVGGKPTAPTVSNPSGWTARGWSTSTSSSGTVALPADITSNTTYYHSWKKTISITYDANSGTGAPDKQSVTNYLDYAGTSTTKTLTISSTVPTRSGYTFMNWNTKNDASGTTYTSGTTVSSSLTLYAKWKLIQNANAPSLKEGMIPVKWNDTSKVWQIADKTNADYDWYDYNTDSKKWANVVTVKESCSNSKTRSYYLSAKVGTSIPAADITSMFVWIPRFSYYVESGYHQAANGTGSFAIRFLSGTTDNIIEPIDGQTKAVRSSSTDGTTNGKKYVVHPAFTNDATIGGYKKEVSGFWVGKFESSNQSSKTNNSNLTNSSTSTLLYGQGDGKNITIRPNVTSWRAISPTVMYTVSKNMVNDGNIHGLSSSDSVTTMMQNSHWGAVAYLTQSNYGNKQKNDTTSGVWNNPYNEGLYEKAQNEYGMRNWQVNLTGMSGSSRNVETDYNSKATSKTNNTDTVQIKYTKMNNDGTSSNGYAATTGSSYTNTYYRYHTANGQKASTTRNIYGIYDMSGGALEYMANYLEKATTDTQVASFLNYSTNRQTPYAGTGKTGSSTDRTTNYNANKAKYGDALWETSSAAAGKKAWNQNSSYFPFFEYPFFIRGGTCTDGSATGIFNYGSGWSVGGYAGGSFRVVLY